MRHGGSLASLGLKALGALVAAGSLVFLALDSLLAMPKQMIV